MIGYVLTFVAGYGFARVVDNPDRARAAARAVAGEGRRIKSAFKDGRASGKRLRGKRR